jgi:hypothetical protein
MLAGFRGLLLPFGVLIPSYLGFCFLSVQVPCCFVYLLCILVLFPSFLFDVLVPWFFGFRFLVSVGFSFWVS